MKRIVVLLSVLATLNGYAQPSNLKNTAAKEGNIVLTKGTKITIVTTSNQDADMGMGMEMKNNAVSTHSIMVYDETPTQFNITSTLTAMKMSMDFMGKQINYDSDKKEDRESEMGKAISESLNKPDSMLLEKGIVKLTGNSKKPAEKEEDNANPMQGMMNAFGKSGSDEIVSGAFFILPKNKKVGDSWTDSTIDKKSKIVKTYTVKSIDKNIATLSITGTADANNEMEVQGMQISTAMNTATTGEFTVDTNTALVSKRNTVANITGTIETMGQSTPVSAKSTITTVYSVN